MSKNNGVNLQSIIGVFLEKTISFNWTEFI